MNRKDLTGKRVFKLTVLRWAGQYGPKGHWECLCDCGKKTFVVTANLTSQKTRSCGCARPQSNRQLIKADTGVSGFTVLYRSYKTQAKRRGYVFELSKEDAHRLFQQNCHYCGAEPSNTSKCSHLKTNEKIESSKYYYSGLDRVNSDLGYTLDNVVPACKHCNKAKMNRPHVEFVKWVAQANKHITERQIDLIVKEAFRAGTIRALEEGYAHTADLRLLALRDKL